jgi:PAS domain S-box-containing protein
VLLTEEFKRDCYEQGIVERTGISSASWLGVPLRTPAQAIGILVVQHYEDRDAYTQRDLEFLSSIGGEIALAIERKRSEKALQKSEEEYRSIFDNATMGIYRSTPDGRLIRPNGALARMLGYDSAEEMRHCNLDRDVYYNRRERAELNAEAASQGSADGIELLWKKKDGTLIWVQLNERAVIGDDGQPLWFDACVQDITKRVQAEEALLDANTGALKEYERLVERIATLGQTMGTARDLTMVFRALRDFSIASVPCDGMVISLYEPEKETRRLAYCWTDNKEFDTSLLVELSVRDGMTGRAIKSGSVIIENDYEEHLKATEKLMVVGDCVADTPQSALSAPMTVMGRTVGCVEIQSYQLAAYREEHVSAMRMAASLAANAVENVTLIQREQANEEQLRQSQKMEAIGQLAGGVAHDFNNLLTVISGYAELSLRRLTADDPLHTNLVEIEKASTRAATLTRQLLAFSRKQMLQAKVLDLNTVVREMDKMLQRLIGEDIELLTLLKPDVGQINADPGQIEQVLMNLVVNARDALPKGGKITIETGNAILDETYAHKHTGVQPGRYVVLTVSDDGHGMDAEIQKRVFDPFFTTKAVGKGTGLGLSTVYGIVKQSEGNISVDSEKGKGTTFKIYLPRVDKGVEARQSSPEVLAVPVGSETVLLVEDEDQLRNLSIEILKECGYEVISAENGEEGLRICKEFEGRIDLMITDVVMPHMNGRELAEQVGRLRPETKVLYMSGYTDDAIIRRRILEDEMSFIQKPFRPDALALRVRELLDPSSKAALR